MPGLFNSTQTTKPELLNGVKPLFKDIMNDATKYYSKGPYSYNKSLVTPFAQSSRDAFTGMKDLAAANSGTSGMAPHLQSIMSSGGFNQGQLDAMGQTRNLANNSGLLELINGNEEASEFLLLQGRPIAEPVVQYGPFVMNTQAEISQTLADYRRTQFGGWPWSDPAPVHGRDAARFARHPGGREEKPKA